MRIMTTAMMSIGVILALGAGSQANVLADIVLLGVAVALIFGAMGLDKGSDLQCFVYSAPGI